LSIVLIGFALSADAFAVSVTSGITIKKNHLQHAMTAGLFFGGFQALMPLLGWFGGSFTSKYVGSFDHWIAFALLAYVGGKMIHEACKKDDENNNKEGDGRIGLYTMLILAIATSLDALAVGLTLAFIDVEIYIPALIIGIITFVTSFIGVYIGKFFGHLFEKKLEVLGGIILIGIGIKTVIDHIFFSQT